MNHPAAGQPSRKLCRVHPPQPRGHQWLPPTHVVVALGISIISKALLVLLVFQAQRLMRRDNEGRTFLQEMLLLHEHSHSLTVEFESCVQSLLSSLFPNSRTKLLGHGAVELARI